MTILENLYNQRKIKRHLSKALFVLKNRPSVDPSIRNKKNSHGLFVISADFELGWAFRYSKSDPNPREMAARARKNFPFLLSLFDECQIPITWATVGHLMLEECEKSSHDWMQRIPYFENRHWRYTEGDWFDCDPHAHWRDAKAWYAPDLIEQILSASAPHEIGCHTFSHMDFTYSNCPEKVAEDEIKACFQAAKKWGISLKSFVFPGGTHGNYEVLKKYGFQTYRKSLEHELSYPVLDEHGLAVLPSSCGLGDNGLGWSAEYYIQRYKKYIRRSIATGTVCHFWFHPSFEEWFLKGVFAELLKYAAAERDADRIWVGTMGEFPGRTGLS